MDSFIHELAGLDLDNCSGGAYREVRLCRYDRGMLLVSNHSTFNYCHISVATVPSAKIFRGCQDSRAYGNPNPKVDRLGELVYVWSDGKWIKDGPWVPLIRDWLIELMGKIDDAREARKRKQEQEIEERIRAKEAKDAALVGAWNQGS